MKIVQSCQKAGLAIAILLLAQASYAGPIVIGNDVIDRPKQNSWSNLVMNLTSEVFPIYGSVTEWSVYASKGGTLGILIFDDGVVTGADYAEVIQGFNSFAFEADSGTDLVEPGFNLGLWLGSAKVAYTLGAEHGDSVTWCLSDGCAPTAPVAGDSITFSGNPIENTYRQYSVSVIDPPVPNGEVNSVPEPATLALMGLGLFGVGFARRKNKI